MYYKKYRYFWITVIFLKKKLRQTILYLSDKKGSSDDSDGEYKEENKKVILARAL